MHGNLHRIAAILTIGTLCVTVGLALPLPLSASTAPPEDAAPTAMGITHGAHLRPVYIPGGNGGFYSYGDEIEAFNSLVGKNIGVVMYFAPWSVFDPFLPDAIGARLPASRRPAIMLTWEPSSNSTGCNLGFGDGLGPLRSIAQGRCDSYIRGFAQALRARPERYLLRLAHEMNITDAIWGAGRWGSTPADYVAMWRRVHDIFAAVGAQNVEWVWSPNYASNPAEAWNDIHAYYPGDDYVDWIGFSGYNWCQWRSRPWEPFSTLYADVVKDFTCRYAKPQIVAEVGSVVMETMPTLKADWISDAYNQLRSFPFVRAIVWFNDYAYARRGDADFRVTTGTADCASGWECSGVQALPGTGSGITQAYTRAVADPIYTSVLPTLPAATPPSTLCGGITPTIKVVPRDRFVKPGGTLSVEVTAMGFEAPIAISFELPKLFTATLSAERLVPPWDSAVLTVAIPTNAPMGAYAVAVLAGGKRIEVPIDIVSVVHHSNLPFVRD